MSKMINSGDSKGFTLIELLIVIAIIGLLGAIAIPMFLGQRTKAMLSEADSNIRILATANENFYAENGRYAPWPDRSDVKSVVGDPGLPYKGVSPAAVGTIEYELRGVKFGVESDLKFKYALESCADGQAFRAKATGKAGTPVAGAVISINERNEVGDGTVACGS
ncbi:type II secretion system protein [Nitrospirota bacterium]